MLLGEAFSKIASSCSQSYEELTRSEQVVALVRRCFQQAPYQHSFVIEWVGSSACGTAITGSDVDMSAVWKVNVDEEAPWDVTSQCFRICDWAISEGLLSKGKHGSYGVAGFPQKLDIVAGIRPSSDEVSWRESAALVPLEVQTMNPALDPDMDYIADWETILNIGLNITKVRAVRQLPQCLREAIQVLKLWSRRIPKKNHFSRPSGYALTVIAAGVVALSDVSLSDAATICGAVWRFLGSIPDGASYTVVQLHVSAELNSATVCSATADLPGDQGLRLIEPFAEFRSPLKRNLLFGLDAHTLKIEALRAASLYDSMASTRGLIEHGILTELFTG